MTSYELGTRYKNYYKFETKLHQPYDFKRDGLVQHIFSSSIVNATNKVFQSILKFWEKSIIFTINYVDRLHNFKNYNWKNR